MTRVLLVGLGRAGWRGWSKSGLITHLTVLEGRKVLLSVCDTDRETAESFAKFCRNEYPVFVSLEEALSTQKFDVVVLATPPETHTMLALRCIEAGVERILIEKPLAATLSDAENFAETVSGKKVRIIVAHQRRYDMEWKQLANYFWQNSITVRDMTVAFPCNELFEKEVAGCGALYNNGTHAADLVNWFCPRGGTIFPIAAHAMPVTLTDSRGMNYTREEYGKSNVYPLNSMYDDLLFSNQPPVCGVSHGVEAMRKVHKLCEQIGSTRVTGLVNPTVGQPASS